MQIYEKMKLKNYFHYTMNSNYISPWYFFNIFGGKNANVTSP